MDIHPARSSQKARRSAVRHSQAVFRRFLEALWGDADFVELHQWATTEITPIFGPLDLAWPLAIGLEVAGGAMWASEDAGGEEPRPWRASPEVAATVARLVTTLRPQVEAICLKIDATPTGRSLVWTTVALIWPGSSAEEQFEQLKDSVGTLPGYSVQTKTAVLEPELWVPDDILRREGIDMQVEVRQSTVPPSPFEVPLTRPGRRQGSGTFESADEFKAVVGAAVQQLRKQGKKPTTSAVLRHLATKLGTVDKGQFARWHQKFGWPTWDDFLRDL